MESKLIDAIQHDMPNVLQSLLPNDTLLNYIFSDHINSNHQILHNGPPIHCVAAYYGSVQCLQFLYDRGSRFVEKDKLSNSILDFASAGNHTELFDFLLNHGYSKQTLCDFSIEKDNPFIIQYLCENQHIDSSSILFQAVKSNCFEILKYIVTIVDDINVIDDFGNTALHIAVANSHHNIIRYLLSLENEAELKTKIDINPKNPINGETILHLAAKKQNTDILSLILSSYNINSHQRSVWDFMTMDFMAIENDIRRASTNEVPKPTQHAVDLNPKDSSGDTPFIIAAREGSVSVLREFISLASDDSLVSINSFNKNGDTALIVSVENNREPIVKELIDLDSIDLNHKNRDGVSALHIACKNQNLEIALMLIHAFNININLPTDFDNATPLHIICSIHNMNNPELSHNAEIIFDTLLQSPDTDLNALNDEKMTPLQLSAKEGNEKFFIKLLQHPKSDISITDKFGMTILHAAARFNHIEICKLIFENCGEQSSKGKIDINQRDNDGWTPLHYAARNAFEDIVELLLSQPGIDVNVKDNRDKPPLYFAMNRNIITMIKNH